VVLISGTAPGPGAASASPDPAGREAWMVGLAGMKADRFNDRPGPIRTTSAPDVAPAKGGQTGQQRSAVQR
jgi:hypothetical protein